MDDQDFEAHLLDALKPWLPSGRVWIAFSGGLDSTVLLHAMVALAARQRLPEVRAIHVHHGLQAVADAWVEHCQTVCLALGVELCVRRVRVDPGSSLERAAREARYGAFQALLGPGELLLQAQHQDDQAETILYRLLRGAGVRGLAAMPASRPLAAGRLVRPLLGVPRAVLQAYAERHGLNWVEDPSNTDTRLARNFLRQEILPRLRRHWPQAPAVLARAAAQQAEAQVLLQELAELDLQSCRMGPPLDWLDFPCLDLDALRQLSSARQRNLLRHWLADFGRLPDSRHWRGWEALRDAAVDASPRWRLDGGELRRHGRRLVWLESLWCAAWAGQEQPWAALQKPLPLPANGTVWFEGAAPAGRLSIAYRQGGEILDRPGRGRRDLKRLLQEAGIPEFIRPRLPLLLREGQVIAIANVLDCAGHGKLRWRPPCTHSPGQTG
ncbi:tRNA lysidine(34) synthetase TilS [Stutzerimonas kirkiae]|uniref:tRNA(Ile)-lysidine synthase n=1 Tax=Stutzerimonas kirkiae TaxID=2211392 RepID=A0A4Q9R665_9GAMM|nr:tRNA lysidine(34) synthetase TilS [Stutzerimonas kirkiae]TBU95520.1 tRNA lysidine(34) synthetase TilS [Stutzerimonas kirkiae]TBV02538.1 tRNA lysidine(34) synthetase TilS [Stutzerimonas kirkiae]